MPVPRFLTLNESNVGSMNQNHASAQAAKSRSAHIAYVFAFGAQMSSTDLRRRLTHRIRHMESHYSLRIDIEKITAWTSLRHNKTAHEQQTSGNS